MIFVFGSNLGGIHGAGAARHAWEHEGAILHQGIGHHGNSYAIPTKDKTIRHSLPLVEIKGYVDDFIEYARAHPEFQFMVTRIGCGLAGFTNEQIAPLFVNAPKNCYFDKDWRIFMLDAYFWNA